MSDSIDKILKKYADSELNQIKERSKIASKKWAKGASTKEILHYLFDIEENPPEQAQLFGDASKSIQWANKTAIVLWPNVSSNFDHISGIEFSDFQKYLDNDIILPLIQEPFRYKGTPKLVPLIAKYKPKSYFWRGNMLYSILSGGDENFKKIGKNI